MTKIIIVNSSALTETTDKTYISRINDLISKLQNVDNIKICVYSTNQLQLDNSDIELIFLPKDFNTYPKAYNYIIEHEKNIENRQYDLLHIIQDNVKINLSPSIFIQSINNLMQTFKLGTWFNTTTDIMNYVYKKYNPRIQIEFNDNDAKKLGLKTLLFTSHANVSWVCVDLTYDIEKLKLNEEFTIPMYYIIDFLARRKQDPTANLAYMNMYPTILEEQNIFELCDLQNKQENTDILNTEYQKFLNYNFDIRPTNNIDIILEKIYTYLKPEENKNVNNLV